MPKAKKTVKKAAKKTNRSKKVAIWGRDLSTIHAVIIGGLFVFASIGAYLTFFSQASMEHREAVKPFVEKPEKGLKWDGLRPGKTGSKCEKLFEAVDKLGKVQGCTHGPDPTPDGVDARQSVEPLYDGETTAVTAAAGSAIPCDGVDGQSGKRVQLMYVHAEDKPDRYDQFASSFPLYAVKMNDRFIESSLATGSLRQLRFVQDPATCAPTIIRATIPATGDDNIANTRAEMRNLGFNSPDRHYMIWMDANVYGGIAYLQEDNSPGDGNANNGGGYARVDSGMWGSGAEVHELLHTFGALQSSAPHFDGGYHCNDSLYDMMCYSGSRSACKDAPGQFDCNKDDYFNTSPSLDPNHYLSRYWNSANSLYLIRDGVLPTPVTPPSTVDTELPKVTINSPVENDQVGSRMNISASATDNVGVVKMQIYIDGSLKASSTTGAISYNWNSRKASKGAHTITVKAYDAAGNISAPTSVTVFKL